MTEYERAVTTGNLEYANKLQLEQISQIQKAEAEFHETHNINAYITFWENLWARNGLIIRDVNFPFILVDLYIECNRYEDALRALRHLVRYEYYMDCEFKIKAYLDRIGEKIDVSEANKFFWNESERRRKQNVVNAPVQQQPNVNRAAPPPYAAVNDKHINNLKAITAPIIFIIVFLFVIVPVLNMGRADYTKDKKNTSSVVSEIAKGSDTSSKTEPYSYTIKSGTSSQSESESTSSVVESKEEDIKSEIESSSKEGSSSKNESSSKPETTSKAENSSISESIEMNTLQTLFASLNTTMTRNDIDVYIANNGLMKNASTWNSTYQIGYDYQAIAERSRDRKGEAIDISFDEEGKIESAELVYHKEYSTQYRFKFKDGAFWDNALKLENGEKAVQRYLNYRTMDSIDESKYESKVESTVESKLQSVAPQPQLQTYVFYGNMDSMCYHTENCQAAQKINDEHRFTYTVSAYSLYDAKQTARQYFESQGYWLCGICGND